MRLTMVLSQKKIDFLPGKVLLVKFFLSAKQDDNTVIIDVVDDGQGFNLEKSRIGLFQEDF